MTGKRVGVIGTGASGIQAIPVIAEQAAQLTVFQRTAQFTIPAENGPLDPQLVALWKQNYREWRRRARHSRAGIPYTGSTIVALEVSDEQRRAAFEAAWGPGGFMFCPGTFNDLLRTEQANRTAADFVRAKIDEIVHDPEMAEMLKPRGLPVRDQAAAAGHATTTQTFNRPNVTLVDLRRDPDRGDHPGRACATSDGDYPAGHHRLRHRLRRAHRAAGGPRHRAAAAASALTEAWRDGPRTYLGLAVPGFPNLFTITGPGSPSVLSNMPVSIEQHVEWIGDCLAYLREHGVDAIEATEAAAAAWTEHVQQVAQRTLLPEGGVLVHGREHPRQAAAVPALHRRRRQLPRAAARRSPRRVRGLRPAGGQPSRPDHGTARRERGS